MDCYQKCVLTIVSSAVLLEKDCKLNLLLLLNASRNSLCSRSMVVD
jgi:hypothetical protein